MINPMDMTGKTVLVTGASAGIGRATCVLLSELGARVCLIARNEENLLKTVSMMRDNGHFILPFDLQNVAQIPSLIPQAVEHLAPLDGLVHSAGISRLKALHLLSLEDDVRPMMDLHFNAAVMLAQGMRKRGMHAPQGSIVFLSSVSALTGGKGIGIYAAAKAALIGLTHVLGSELAPAGIRVNSVVPGLVRTDMYEASAKNLTDEQLKGNSNAYPLGIGRPRDVANAIVFLLSNASSWITGSSLLVDGGATVS